MVREPYLQIEDGELGDVATEALDRVDNSEPPLKQMYHRRVSTLAQRLTVKLQYLYSVCEFLMEETSQFGL